MDLEALRLDHRPSTVRVVLVGESPPDPGSEQLRFFYSPVLTRYDNLYRAVTLALYEGEPGFDLTAKEKWLRRLQSDGFWLVDAVREPVNWRTNRERRTAIAAGLPNLVRQLSEAAPTDGVVVCHGVVYDITSRPIREAGFHVLHDRPIPFPLGNWRRRFVEEFRRAVLAGHPRPQR